MGLKITASKLLSRVIRSNTIAGKSGKDLLSGGGGGALRKIDFSGRLGKGTTDGGLLGWAWNAVTGFVGWTFSAALGGLAWTVSRTWGLIVGTVEKLKSFNWNATEVELENAIKARNDQLAGIWGGVVGAGVGWLAGIGVGAGVALICPTIGGANLARLVAGAVTEEAVEEMKSRLQSALSQTVSLITSSLAVNFYLNYRSWLRDAPEDLLKTIYSSDTVDWIKRYWGRDGQPEVSFNKSMDNLVEGLPGGQAVKNFAENFLEESWDSFIEAGFIVAHQLDEAYQQSKLASQKAVLGADTSIEITLDKAAPNDTIAYSAIPEKLVPTVIQQTINTHRLIHKKDIGQWVGEPFSEAYQAALPMQRKLTLFFREAKTPPYKQIGGDGKIVQISIPDLKPNTTWKEVKAVCDSYTWGDCFAVCKLNNRRSITVFAATQDLAAKLVRKFASLSSASIVSINTSKEEFKDARLIKRPTTIYPSYCTLLFRKEATEGRTMLDGKTLTEKVSQIILYTDSPQTGKSNLDTWHLDA